MKMSFPKLKNRISITEKFILYFLMVYLFVIGSVTFLIYNNAKNAILDRTFQQLTSLKHVKKRQIEQFFSDRINDAKNFAGILSIPEKTTGSINAIQLSHYMQEFIKRNDYFDAYVIKPVNGKEMYLTSEDKNNIITNIDFLNSDPLEIIKEPVIHDYKINPASGQPDIYVESDYAINNNIYKIYIRIPYKHIENIIFENDPAQGLGLSGESYLVGSDYLMRSQSRFLQNSMLKVKVNTSSVKKAFAGESGTDVIRDYRDVEVLSSFAKLDIPGLDWALLAEIDMEEAVKPAIDIRSKLLILVLGLSLLIFSITYFITRKITKPLISLTKAANELATNNRTDIIVPSSDDEIGDLTKSFNHLSQNLAIKEEELHQERLKRFTAVMDAQEQEKERLARELHDGLGQMFVALKLKLELIDDSSSGSNDILNDVKAGLDDTVDEIRAMSNNLLPSVLKEIGLVPAISNLCTGLSKISPINFKFEHDDSEETPDKMKKIYIFRVVQEALNNIIKHSNARNAVVRLLNNSGRLEISDNGTGFIMEENLKNQGNGIFNMKERILSLGGDFEISSSKDKGTKIIIQLPE